MKKTLIAIFILLFATNAWSAGKISDLGANSTPAGGDLIETVDVSDPSMAATGTNTKTTVTELFATPEPLGATTPNTVGATTVTASGVVSVDDTTDSTSSTTGSIHTDGGLGVAKDVYVDGGIIEADGVLKQNLLTNTQWMAASNSTFEDVGSDLVTNGDFATDITGWTDASTGSGSIAWNAGGFMDLIGLGLSDRAKARQNFAVTVGKLYDITFTLGSSSNEAVRIGSAFSLNDYTPSAYQAPGDGTFTFAFEATTATLYLEFEEAAANTMTLDDVEVFEKTPGFVAADDLCFDGWTKNTNLDVWRQHTDATVTKDGSFYAAKMTSGAADQRMKWPRDIHNNAEFYKKVEGRTLTVGYWAYSSDTTLETSFLEAGWTDQSTTVTANTWTWIEKTTTVSDGISQWQWGVNPTNGATVYISQPMLVFGSSIGSGNYAPIPNEVIWFENGVASTTLQANGFSDVGSTTLNMEADSNGAIGKGAAALFASAMLKDSGSAGEEFDSRIRLGGADSAFDAPIFFSAAGLANDSRAMPSAWIALDTNGDMQYQIDASGASTLDVVQFGILGIQTR